MPPKYGFSHPDLPDPVPTVTRWHAEAVVQGWPGAQLMHQTRVAHNGVRGRCMVWSKWTPVPVAPAATEVMAGPMAGQMLIPAAAE